MFLEKKWRENIARMHWYAGGHAIPMVSTHVRGGIKDSPIASKYGQLVGHTGATTTEEMDTVNFMIAELH